MTVLEKQVRGLSDRQSFLLIYVYSKQAIATHHAEPYKAYLGGRQFENPGGLGMANVRGLERRGWVCEQTPGLFYITPLGVQAAEHAVKDQRWT